jgi:hypothetical protein
MPSAIHLGLSRKLGLGGVGAGGGLLEGGEAGGG